MTWHSSVVTFGGRAKDDRVLRLCMFRAGSQDLGGCVAGRLGRKNSLKRSCGAPGRLEHHVRPRPGLSNRSLKQEVPAGRGTGLGARSWAPCAPLRWSSGKRAPRWAGSGGSGCGAVCCSRRQRRCGASARGGRAATHWPEGRSEDVNAVASDFTATETYPRRRRVLLPAELAESRGTLCRRHSGN